MKYPLLVNPQWLHDNLDNSEIEIIDNSRVIDFYSRSPIKGAFGVPHHPYLKRHSASGELTQHVMERKTFLTLCYNLGLNDDKHYVVYDDDYGLFAARFWFVCRYFGLHNFSILNGSGKGWRGQGRPVSDHMESPVTGRKAMVREQKQLIVRLSELETLCTNSDVQIWDTRSRGEYNGVDSRGNLRQGHMPAALHLEWTDMLLELESEHTARFFRPLAEIDQMLSRLGLRRDKTIITYCQSGIRAAFCNFVLELLGYPNHRLYDASMGEWANRPNTPLEKT